MDGTGDDEAADDEAEQDQGAHGESSWGLGRREADRLGPSVAGRSQGIVSDATADSPAVQRFESPPAGRAGGVAARWCRLRTLLP
jgi:hypothetical protein